MVSNGQQMGLLIVSAVLVAGAYLTAVFSVRLGTFCCHWAVAIYLAGRGLYHQPAILWR